MHGSAGALEARARHLRDFSRAFETAGQGMRSLSTGAWQGEAADAFRQKFDMHPKQWLTAADACEAAAEALEAYADTVRWAQGQAQAAIDAYRDAQETSRRAVDAHNARVTAYNQAADRYNAALAAGEDPGARPTEPGAFTDPGEAGRREAEEILAEARRQRTDVARDAARRVAAAAETAPPT
ncbi:type IV secretion protein Rhs, partial [Streptomyces sp. TRM76130]|nr:type IV secretion protein Rhs [Streptomyces sp. TRM76130]